MIGSFPKRKRFNCKVSASGFPGIRSLISEYDGVKSLGTLQEFRDKSEFLGEGLYESGELGGDADDIDKESLDDEDL